jgi:hypothetical protein
MGISGQPKIHRASKYPAQTVENIPKNSENSNTSTKLFSIYCNIVNSLLAFWPFLHVADPCPLVAHKSPW